MLTGHQYLKNSLHVTKTYLVCSMTTLKGILGIQEMKQTTVKIAKIRKTIPPDQYFLDSM
jgi:hypothetical protein